MYTKEMKRELRYFTTKKTHKTYISKGTGSTGNIHLKKNI